MNGLFILIGSSADLKLTKGSGVQLGTDCLAKKDLTGEAELVTNLEGPT